MTTNSLSLDLDEINQKIENESLMPAVCVGSEYKPVPLADRDNPGMTIIRDVWEVLWDRLDRDTTGDSGKKFLYQSSNWLPDESREVTNRSQMQYVKQVQAFAALGIKGKEPEDFLGQQCWIKETTEPRASRSWWKPVAKYVEGQSFEEATGGIGVAINPPSSNGNTPVPVAESNDVEVGEGSPYDELLNVINGKTHRAAITALKSSSVDQQLTEAVQSGTLLDDLIEQKFLREEDGKYYKVVDA